MSDGTLYTCMSIGDNTCGRGLSAIYSEDKGLSLLGIIDLTIVMIVVAATLYAVINDTNKNHFDYLSLLWVCIGLLYIVPIILSVGKVTLEVRV